MAFETDVQAHAPGGEWAFRTDVFVKDLVTGLTTLVSPDRSSQDWEFSCQDATLSIDGRFVAFASDADSLNPPGYRIWDAVHVKDLQTGVTRLISSDSAGQASREEAAVPAISGNGRFVAFYSADEHLVADDRNSRLDVFVKDGVTGETLVASGRHSAVTGPASAPLFLSSTRADVSRDGRLVVFTSQAATLVPGDTNDATDVFLHDVQAGITTRISTDRRGREAVWSSHEPAIDDAGQHVVFVSGSSNLVPGDTNLRNDIFVKDLATGMTTRVNVGSAGQQADNESETPAISADGRYVVFASSAGNLVAGDTNGDTDIFVADLLTGRLVLANTDAQGRAASRSRTPPSTPTAGMWPSKARHAISYPAIRTNTTTSSSKTS